MKYTGCSPGHVFSSALLTPWVHVSWMGEGGMQAALHIISSRCPEEWQWYCLPLLEIFHARFLLPHSSFTQPFPHHAGQLEHKLILCGPVCFYGGPVAFSSFYKFPVLHLVLFTVRFSLCWSLDPHFLHGIQLFFLPVTCKTHKLY